ncbi:MAG: MaoC family dehydratase [Deltaproteobacteria bacterium]|nr:MaoC family dehydratase [Deltaproteobacteria bacterium]
MTVNDIQQACAFNSGRTGTERHGDLKIHNNERSRARRIPMAEKIEVREEWKSQIGVDSPPWTYEVTTTSVRAFARGVGYTDPVYYDTDAAQAAGYRNLPAPPCYLGTPVFIPGKSDDTFSGPLTAGVDFAQFGLVNVLDGGSEVEYFDVICAGDTLTAVSRLVGLDVRESKALGQMLILSFEMEYKNQNKVVMVSRGQAILY